MRAGRGDGPREGPSPGPPRHREGRGVAGVTLVELLAVTAILAIVLSATAAVGRGRLDHERARAAAHYLAGRLAAARALAVHRAANVALRLDGSGPAVSLALFEDGNGNGVRRLDIAAGIDPQVAPPVVLGDRFPGVVISETDPTVPGAAARAEAGLFSFTPHGTATSGSLYLSGASGDAWAVRVLGATARVRVLRYAPRDGAWVGD